MSPMDRATRNACADASDMSTAATTFSYFRCASLLTISTGKAPLRITRSMVVPTKMSSRSWLAVTAHDNQVRANLRSRAKDPVEWVARDDHWPGPDTPKLRH